MNAYAYLYPFFCGVTLTILIIRAWRKANEFKTHEIERVLVIRQ